MTQPIYDVSLLQHRSAAAEPFWEAARRAVLLIQQCRACARRQFYPRSICHHCWSDELEWVECEGKAQVHSYTICHTPPHPSFAGMVPLVIAIVDLNEGVRMTTNIVDCSPQDVRIGMELEVVFEHVTPDATLVKFRPARSAGRQPQEVA